MALGDARHLPEPCPAAEELAQYVERTLDSPRRAAIEAHLLQCDDCRHVVVETAAMADETGGAASSRNRVPGWWFAGGLAAAAAAVVIAVALSVTNPENPPLVANPPASPDPPGRTEIAGEAPRAGAARPEPDASGPGALAAVAPQSVLVGDDVSVLNALPPDQAAAVRDALRTLMLERPASVATLIVAGDPLRSSGTGAPRLIEPVGTQVASVRPEFRWEPVTPGTEYQVIVFDEEYREVVTSDWVASEPWTPDVDLQRGATYSWQLAARRGTDITRTPGLAGPEARFRVLDAAEAAAAEALRARAADAPVVRAVLLTRAGLLDDAARALAEAETRYRGSDVPARLRAALERIRSGSPAP